MIDNLLERSIADNLEALDISPSMFKEATEHYQSVSKFLCDQEIDADFYPQGSFATGTVVRPYKKDSDGYFDLDVVCRRNVAASTTMPSATRTPVENVLTKSGLYRPMMKSYPECLTLRYVENGKRGGFRLDIVIAAYRQAEDSSSDPIAIAKHDKHWEWLNSNPKALINWFNAVNEPYSMFSSGQERDRLFKSNRGIYASIEDVPREMERTSLQRTIQVLKRSRDVYTTNARIEEELMPSCVIMVLAGTIAQTCSPASNTIELLPTITRQLSSAVSDGQQAVDALLASATDPNDGQPLVRWKISNQRALARWLEEIETLIGCDTNDSAMFDKCVQHVFGKDAMTPKASASFAPAIITKPTRPWAC